MIIDSNIGMNKAVLAYDHMIAYKSTRLDNGTLSYLGSRSDQSSSSLKGLEEASELIEITKGILGDQ
jgi:hypothetical protein